MGSTRVLLLAGTSEAAALARLLAERPDIEVMASFAGHTSSPTPLPCPTRTGGFGGVEGLSRHLRTGGYHLVVDATHPFAGVLPHNVATAAIGAGVPRVRLIRPPWRPGPGDRWTEVADLAAAATALPRLGARRALLTIGRLQLALFAGVPHVHMVVRSIEPPDPLPLPDATVLLERGPFSLDHELALMREHDIDTMVTKNSGGGATVAKLAAARRLGIRVVVVCRPPTPPGPVVETPEAALCWIDEHRPA